MTLQRSRTLFLSLSCFCCSGPVAPLSGELPDLGSGAGARLRPQIVEADDSDARRFLQLIDTETELPCRLGYAPVPGWPEGKQVACAPRGYGSVVFLDPSCSTPLVATSQNDPWVNAGGFPPVAGVARLGARVASRTPERYMLGADQECLVSGISANIPLFEIAELVPDEALAHGTLEEVELSETLTAIVFDGDDGSRILYDLFDRTARVACTPQMTEAGARCQADMSGFGEIVDDGLLDLECERLVVLEYTVDPVSPVEDSTYRFELAEDQMHVGRLVGGRCTVEPQNRGRKTLYVGVPYPAIEWPQLGLVALGSERLTARASVLPSGESGEAETRVDQVAMFEDRGEPCGPVWIDGTLRCAPAPAPEVTWWTNPYSDSECTRPAIMLDHGSPPDVVTVREGFAGADRGSLAVGRVLEVGGELGPGQAFERSYESGACGPSSYKGRSFALADEVPAAEFPELHLVTK